jgi:uncharacterized protein YndB with AHSA1/START domain
MPHIRHSLIISAPIEKVYEAITTSEGLSRWWTPDTDALPQVGSHARFHFSTEYYKEMLITELIPLEWVAWRCTKGATEWIDTSITFRLEHGDRQAFLQLHPEISGQIQQQGNGENLTLLSFAHDNWQEYTPMFAECSYTWGRFLQSLKLLCETGNGLPWPKQHEVH